MVTKKELLQAIEQCEQDPITYANCQKLAVFGAILDRYYGDDDRAEERSTHTANVIYTDGGSEFLDAINGMPSEKVWSVLDELLDVIQTINPKLYDGVLRRLKE